MTRTSTNLYVGDRMMNGFDYKNQAWVIGGVYVDCGHPEPGTVLAPFPGLRGEGHVMEECGCYGREHVGEATQPGQDHMDGRLVTA